MRFSLFIQVDGVAGAITFDHNGDSAHGAFSVYTLQNGQWVWIKQLSLDMSCT